MSELGIGSVIGAAGRVEGRVKLQKMIYLLQQMGYDLSYDDFVFLLHGPYSDDLAADLDRATRAVVEETQEDSPMLRYVATGEPVKRYVYKLREGMGDSVGVPPSARHGSDKERFAALVNVLNAVTSPLLEVVASAVYVRDEEGIQDGDELFARVKQLKPERSSFIDRAKRLLAEWDKQGLLGA